VDGLDRRGLVERLAYDVNHAVVVSEVEKLRGDDHTFAMSVTQDGVDLDLHPQLALGRQVAGSFMTPCMKFDNM
jgi:hypothetical protein